MPCWMSTAQRTASTGARELDQQAVAGGLDDAALVLGDHGVDQFAPMRFEPLDRAFFVGADQPRVAHDVCGENGGEPAFHVNFRS